MVKIPEDKKTEKKAAKKTEPAPKEQTSHTIDHMDYNPEDAEKCWPKGFFKAQLTEAILGESKSSGEKMLTVQFKVWSGDDTQVLFDHIVPKTLHKMKRLAFAFDQSEEFMDRSFQPVNFIDEGLIVELGESDDETHGKQNKIVSYRRKDWEPTDKDLLSRIAPDLKKPAFS